MKKILFLFLLVTGFSFSQDKIFEAKVTNPKKLESFKTSGELSFTFPSSTTKENIEKTAKYYTQFFTVTFDEKKSEVLIKMVNNDEKSRHIINRFLIANKISQVNLDGQLFKVEAFYETHLK